MPGRASQGGADRARRIIECVDDWVFGEPLSDLLALFGRKLPATGEAAPPPDALAFYNEELPPWLYQAAIDPGHPPAAVSAQQLDLLHRTLAVERIADEVFNFRGRGGKQYVERAQADFASFDPAETERILASADRLGLVTPKAPQHTEYAETLILGGGYARPLSRASHAHALQTAGVDLGRLSFLGSARRLIKRPPERPAADTYAPDATDEFGLLIGAARTVFELSPRPPRFLCGCRSADRICPRWRLRDTYEGEVPAPYTHERQADLTADHGRQAGSVLSASTGRPPDRPNTADTLDLWTRVACPPPGQRVLVVTSQYFVPFQGFDCLRLLYLPYAIKTDVVGFDDQLADPAHRPGYLLMETLSAIRSARRLLIAAVEALAAPDTELGRPRLESAHAARAGRADA